MITTVDAASASDRASSPADSNVPQSPGVPVMSSVLPAEDEPEALQGSDSAIGNLHAEISTLKSARQTDAYLLQVKEREILELRNLLQERAKSDNSAVFNPVCASPETDWLSPSSIDNSLRSRRTLSLRATSCAEESSASGTFVCEGNENCEETDLQGFDCHLVTDVTKICDSPVLQQPQRALSNISAGVSMERTAALSGALNARTNADSSNPSEESANECTADINRYSRTRFPLSIIVPQIQQTVGSQASPSPPELTAESLTQEKTSPSFREQDFNAAGNKTASTDSHTLGSATADIWGEFSQKLLISSKPVNQSATPGFIDGLQEDSSSFLGRIFDQECVNRFGKQHLARFNLDPTSPAYVPSSRYRPQSRIQSHPGFPNDAASKKNPWIYRMSQGNICSEFDDVNGMSQYSTGNSDYGGIRTAGYLSGGFMTSGEYDEYSTFANECSTFGDALQYQILVDKIVQTNDQPASLHLQQNIKYLSSLIQSSKVDSATMGAAIRSRNQLMDAVKPQGLLLMRNRFGNFLMQRCLEYGTRDQVKVLVGLMVGQVYPLSCDRFGCHVVQKALDVCEDETKQNIVAELFRAIPETVTHRFACHVWQRVFETKWGVAVPSTISANALEHFPLTSNLPETSTPAQVQTTYAMRTKISAKVDAALKGQWHLVANDENGSLVVQCIFENCVDSDKREIIKEVLVYAADIAKGQWGNWVIQHLLDHGTPVDKSLIFKVVARNVFSMSVDQFASKVVEKVLKSCQRRELYDIVDVVINPVMRDNGCPCILDMMNNQYANYVVQNILTLSEPSQRDICVRLIAPHLSVLRGSKYGQRVAAIVEKHIRTNQHRFNAVINAGANPPLSSINVLNQFTRPSALNSHVNGSANNSVTNVPSNIAPCGMSIASGIDFEDTYGQQFGHYNPVSAGGTNTIATSFANLSLQQVHHFQPASLLPGNGCNNSSAANGPTFLIPEHSQNLYFHQQQQQQQQFQQQQQQQVHTHQRLHHQFVGTSPTGYSLDNSPTSQLLYPKLPLTPGTQAPNIIKQQHQQHMPCLHPAATPLLPSMPMAMPGPPPPPQEQQQQEHQDQQNSA
ncbi:hypothetical protein HDU84_006899 [Entophlyctis sp. JEL0112]|nr:hypothetical protein HDU84_006899 [Entophlyctis sp. JEL0112]